MTDRQSTIAQVGAVLVGLMLGGAGGFFLYLEMKTPPSHAMHVYIFAGMMAFGALLIVPGPFVSALKSIAPYLPKFGPAGPPPTNPPG